MAYKTFFVREEDERRAIVSYLSQRQCAGIVFILYFIFILILSRTIKILSRYSNHVKNELNVTRNLPPNIKNNVVLIG